jgi:hypothetical protein
MFSLFQSLNAQPSTSFALLALGQLAFGVNRKKKLARVRKMEQKFTPNLMTLSTFNVQPAQAYSRRCEV